ncbi:Cys-tRNA(Pro) deacylase [Staphylococcus kloosii]|jgi:Cys-tRNA(Pro)/Cys-tRNA(Cys) deacylase|uniref:Cys-tRNA(Pro) deacylase n=1 Tax=Staphylococcus kloosii TaxID=29384 RepID=UPI00189EA71C|nr:Cys-tRNA(Pro) deacylase [Staphylococcus kloosii]MBF7023559.1 Cys-tRNA(Pro) deacylase [Staphylococcus kloosii]
MKHKKTNAMRILEKANIDYEINKYEVTNKHIDGATVAQIVGVDVKFVYKTLVLENAQHECFVFVIPVEKTLNMKQAAHTAQQKKLTLLPLERLKQVTGYVRGGCSPIGMKKHFPTYIDESALQLQDVYVSGGERGMQIKINSQDLIHITKAETANLIE